MVDFLTTLFQFHRNETEKNVIFPAPKITFVIAFYGLPQAISKSPYSSNYHCFFHETINKSEKKL